MFTKKKKQKQLNKDTSKTVRRIYNLVKRL